MPQTCSLKLAANLTHHFRQPVSLSTEMDINCKFQTLNPSLLHRETCKLKRQYLRGS